MNPFTFVARLIMGIGALLVVLGLVLTATVIGAIIGVPLIIVGIAVLVCGLIIHFIFSAIARPFKKKPKKDYVDVEATSYIQCPKCGAFYEESLPQCPECK